MTRVRIDLADGAHMDVTVIGDPDRELLDALRDIGEAAARKLVDDERPQLPDHAVAWFRRVGDNERMEAR